MSQDSSLPFEMESAYRLAQSIRRPNMRQEAGKGRPQGSIGKTRRQGAGRALLRERIFSLLPFSFIAVIAGVLLS